MSDRPSGGGGAPQGGNHHFAQAGYPSWPAQQQQQHPQQHPQHQYNGQQQQQHPAPGDRDHSVVAAAAEAAPPSNAYQNYYMQLHNFNYAANAAAGHHLATAQQPNKGGLFAGFPHHAAAAAAQQPHQGTPYDYSRPLPAHSPLPAHLRGGATAAHMKGNPYGPGGYPTPPPAQSSFAASQVQQQLALAHSAAAYTGSVAAATAGSDYSKAASVSNSSVNGAVPSAYSHMPQQYGDPKAFPAAAAPPTASQQPPSAYSKGGYYGAPLSTPPPNGSSANNSARSSPANAGSYDQIAAQILNSFSGGSNQFSQNLIHKDIAKSSSVDTEGVVNLTCPSPARATEAASSSSTSTAARPPAARTILNTPTVSASSSPAPPSYLPPSKPASPALSHSVASQLNSSNNNQKVAEGAAAAPATPAGTTNGNNNDSAAAAVIAPPELTAKERKRKERRAEKEAAKLALNSRDSSNSSSMSSGIFKRKKSLDSKDPSAKKSRKERKPSVSAITNSILSSVLSGQLDQADPYSFDEEEKKMGNNGGSPAAAKAVTALTAGSGSSAGSSRKNSNASSGPVYKFKNALLSRESRASSTESRSSTSGGPAVIKTKPLSLDNGLAKMFDPSESAFLSACSNFISDMEINPPSVSSRPCMNAYRARLAIKSTQKKRGRKSNAEKAAVAAAEEAERNRLLDSSRDESADRLVLDDDDDDDEDQLVVAEDEESAAEDDEDDIPLLKVKKNAVKENSKSVQKTPVKKKAKKKSGDSDEEENEEEEEKETEKSEEEASPRKRKSPGRKKKEASPSKKSKAAAANCDSKNGNNSNGSDSAAHSDETSSQKENNRPKEDATPNTKPKKKGRAWALPFIPPLPTKPADKRLSRPASPEVNTAAPEASTSNADQPKDLTNVWLQAFGGVKPKKAPEVAPTPSLATGAASSRMIKEEEKATKKKTYLDIPPEVRRRPRPTFGGLIHFAPDWESKVNRYHKGHCRLPPKLMQRKTQSRPSILNSKNASSTLAAMAPLMVDAASPTSSVHSPLISPMDSSVSSSHPGSPEEPTPSTSSDLLLPSLKTVAGRTPIIPRLLKPDIYASPGSPKTVVDSILEKRRARIVNGRMYKVPFMKEIRKEVKKKTFDQLPEDGLGLMATPGLPLLTQDTTDVLMGSNFGNFRRQTLLRYLDSLDDPELKAKVLDWRPEVFETKTRRQSSQIKAVTSYKEIFGIDKPKKKSAKELKKEKKEAAAKKQQEVEEQEQIQEEEKKKAEAEKKVKEEIEMEEKKKMEIITEEENKKASSSSSSAASKKKGRKSNADKAKENKRSKDVVQPPPTPEVKSDVSTEMSPPAAIPPPPAAAAVQTPSKSAFAEDDYEPSEAEEKLQIDLQNFALDLLDDNPSWTQKKVIQNLVIWEPIDPVPFVPEKRMKKKSYKYKKRKSGMDFNSAGKKKSKSRDVSRAGSLEPASTVAIKYSLENVVAESKGWVVDKGAGETIIQRAAKMGYPDVIAYALDILRMNPSLKDNAGIPPIHKAAFRGHGDIVRMLLRYGVDPNTNTKGTRPLHEALEGGNVNAVRELLQYGADPMLYDYSGNMPIELTEDNEEMKLYLGTLLADLHGKKGERWSVSHAPEYYLPKEAEEAKSDSSSDEDDDFSMFESSSQPLPAYFQLSDREGRFVLKDELKAFVTKASSSPSKSSSSSEALKRLETVELSSEEFGRLGHCTLLGYKRPLLPAADSVELLLVDAAVKKLLGIELPSSSSPVKNAPAKKRKSQS